MHDIRCGKSEERSIREHPYLNEVIIIRLVLISCLILYHSFAPYANAWAPFSVEFIPAYYWISKISYSFFLGSFVFISGYLYAYADLTKGSQSFRSVLQRKTLRLFIPSIIFSILYLAIFGLKNGESPIKAIYSVIEGRGHMWFLPMLFWLFLATELLKRIRGGVNPKKIILITFILSVGAFFPLPLRINIAFQYLLFFYLGYSVKHNPNTIFALGDKLLIISLITWLSVFFCVEWIALYKPLSGLLPSRIINVLMFYGRIIYTISGTVFIYTLSIDMINKYHFKASNTMAKISGLCFGIYLYQQFILIYLYYHTDFVANVGIMWAPWLGFIIALILSTVLSCLTIQTRLGRALIG